MDKGKIFKALVTLAVFALVAYGLYYMISNGFQTISLKKFNDSEGSEKINITTTQYFISLRNKTEIPELEVFLMGEGENTKIYLSRSEIWGCVDGEYFPYKIQSREIPSVAFVPMTLSNSSDWDLSYFVEAGEVGSCGDSDLDGQTSIPNYLKKELVGESELLFVYGKASKQMIVSN